MSAQGKCGRKKIEGLEGDGGAGETKISGGR